jgi:hypothetical protein
VRLRADRTNEGHLSCVQRLERRRGFQAVGKVGGWCSHVGLTDVAETVAWVLMGEGWKGVPTLVLVVTEGVDEEEKEEEGPLGR